MNVQLKSLGAAFGVMLLGACSHLSSLPGVTSETSSADEAAAPRERVRSAIELLGSGDERRARAELRAVLRAQPDHATARRLLEQIETDPEVLLGERGRSYTVRAGETMSQIAERYLGDGLLFYALARYNGIAAPDQLAAGQTLRLPQRSIAAARPASSSAAASMNEAPALPPPGASRADAERANQLRLQALQRLNAGEVDRAVSLLRQAQALDGANAAVQRDLDRAVRLQASLRASQ